MKDYPPAAPLPAVIVPQVEIDNLPRGYVTLPKTNPVTSRRDVEVLLWLVHRLIKKTDETTLVEFGCHRGHTTYQLAYNFPDCLVVGVDCLADGVDLSAQQRSEQLPQYQIGELTTNLHNCKIELSPISKLTLDAGTRFVFIDDDHTFEGVKAATQKALECIDKTVKKSPVSLNYIIAWHDYTQAHRTGKDAWMGVSQYVQHEFPKLGLSIPRYVFDSNVAFAEILL